ncbi:MAG: hypothetical protein JOY62_14820 [Acidobacteriaceae bacterium]|nr:hypothetical protein [Acidobacteriaceae bacterium]MBV9781234.1 hypothetical protein [Acidobacteriaceae bacterium]
MKIRTPRLGTFISVLGLPLLTIALASSATVDKVSVFASGKAINATAPDSITIANGSIWVSYGNGADSTGLKGSSTVVKYDRTGKVLKTFSIRGNVDGLKFDPETGIIWALQNQDGNSTLTLIDPETGIISGSPLSYAVKSSTRGYDDVAFLNGKIYLSYTNPTGPGDDTIQRLDNLDSPLRLSCVLQKGALGFNLATGVAKQATTQNDPDSLSTTPFGLMLTSGDDGQLIFVQAPGTPAQSVSFLQLIDSTGAAVSGLDDAVWTLTPKGTFFLSDTNNNRVLKIEVSNLLPSSLYASVGSLNTVGNVDLDTGTVTPFITDVNGPHGLLFLPDFKSLFGK